jgi:hypothetical protein
VTLHRLQHACNASTGLAKAGQLLVIGDDHLKFRAVAATK